MEKNVYDFLKNLRLNKVLIIKQEDEVDYSKFYDNNLKFDTTIISVTTDLEEKLRNSLSNEDYEVIINNTNISSENFLNIINQEYLEIPLLIVKSDFVIELNNDLSRTSISDSYDLIYNFKYLDNKINNHFFSNKNLENNINNIYLSEYYHNRTFSNKLSSAFYPISLLVNSNKIGGIKKLAFNIKGYKKLVNNDFFNTGYYLRNYDLTQCDNVYLHYLYTGSKKGFKPNEIFDNESYLKTNPDLKSMKINPSLHYILYGEEEGRKIFSNIRGALQTSFKDNILKGWIAELGNTNPLTTFIRIDGEEYLVLANIYREDLDLKKINHGEHGFEMAIPKKYLDNKRHKIELLTPEKVKIDELEYKSVITKKRIIKGTFQSNIKDTLLKGWIAEIGNNKPLTAYIKIDDASFAVVADIYREDLKKKKINNGKHGFEFTVPPEFINDRQYKIQLIFEGKVISEINHSFANYDYENNIERFFANSMISPEMILPPTEARKKILSIMDNIAKYLVDKVTAEPLVSVIMPVYNRENLITDAVNSVLNQSYGNIELIIINDYSTDNTLKVLEDIDDNRIKIINNPTNFGVSKSRNIGLKESSGKYIMYLDSDNDWEKDYVKSTVGAFSILEDADAVYSGQYVYEKDKNNLQYIRYGTINKGLLSNRNYIDLNCFSHTRNIYEKEGGFDESLNRFVDWDLILKYMTFGKIYSIPVILSNYYNNIAENSISNDAKLLNQKQEVIRKHEKRLNSLKIDYDMKHRVSVIIPSYESLDDLKECLNALISLNASWLEIIVVDNNSSEDVLRYLVKIKNKHGIKVIFNKKNLGFTYAVNQAIEIADIRNDILLLNNDAVITKNAIKFLQKAAYELKDCGMTVPQQVLPANTKTMNIHVPFAQKDVECDVNLSNSHKNIINVPLFHNGEYTELSFAPFFCVYIKRETYNKSLGLDAEHGRHYRSDMIFCNYVRTVLNQKIYHVSDARIYHKLQQSTSTLKEKSAKEHNLLYVQNRWLKDEQEKYGFKQAKWDFD